VNVVWLPPDYGDAIACVCADGTLSLWEEVAEGKLFLCPLRVILCCSMFLHSNYLHFRDGDNCAVITFCSSLKWLM
jgi:hypothetical protein